MIITLLLSRFCTEQSFKFFSSEVFKSTLISVDLSDSGASPHCAPLSPMPLMNATGYRTGFLPFLVANSIFTLEEFVITTSFLRLRLARLHARGHWESVRTTVFKYYVTCHNGPTCGIRLRMPFNPDGNFTNTVIQFTPMCLLLSLARMWPSSHLRTR